MKKILLMCLATLFALTTWAYDFEVDGIYYQILDQNICGVTWLYYQSEDNSVAYEGEIVIPHTVSYENTEYAVTFIGNQAFAYCHNLTSVVIPESVTTIYAYAFAYCENLVSVNIPNTVTEIFSFTFSGCTGLKSFEIPESILVIGSYAFGDCTGIESVIMGSNVETIQSYAFSNCTGLQSINIPNKLSSLESSAFIGCTSLTFANVPDLVTEVRTYTFKDCTSLKTISLGHSVEAISTEAFYNCTSLKEVYSYNHEPPTVSPLAFSNVDIKRATLYVPKGTSDTYRAADTWGTFSKIREMEDPDADPDGINSVSVDASEIEGIYSIGGQQLNSLQSSINIIRYKDGTTKKTLIK